MFMKCVALFFISQLYHITHIVGQCNILVLDQLTLGRNKNEGRLKKRYPILNRQSSNTVFKSKNKHFIIRKEK